MIRGTRATLIHELQNRIGQMEQAGRNSRRLGTVSSGFAALDRLLPGGGFTGGTLVEWLGDGSGALTLATAAAGEVVRERGILVVVGLDTLYPPAAAALGVPLERTVVVRPGEERMAWWVWEQALRCEGIAVALGRLSRAGDAVVRRLQLAAETGGGLGFLVRPASCRDQPSWAETRLLIAGSKDFEAKESDAESDGDAVWRLRVERLRCRGSFGGQTAWVELHHEADDVPVVSELADPAD